MRGLRQNIFLVLLSFWNIFGFQNYRNTDDIFNPAQIFGIKVIGTIHGILGLLICLQFLP
jgi:hypothetical protein